MRHAVRHRATDARLSDSGWLPSDPRATDLILLRSALTSGRGSMTVASTTSVNVKQAVPFFGVTNMEASLRFYVDGLGFRHPQLRRPLAFLGPRFPASPSLLPMRKEHRNSTRPCQRALSPLSRSEEHTS